MTDQETTMPTVTGKYHPAALVLPEMTEQEYRELVDDIREHGQREPISEDQDGRILDGRHRWRACQELGIEPNIVRHAPPFDGPELEAWKIQFVISRNIHRRHLTTTQRAAIAAELATMKRGTRTDLPSNDGKSPGLSNKQAAQMMKVSEPTVERAKARMRDDPKAHETAKAGTLERRKRAPKPLTVDGDCAPATPPQPRHRINVLETLRQLDLALPTHGFGNARLLDDLPEFQRADAVRLVNSLWRRLGWLRMELQGATDPAQLDLEEAIAVKPAPTLADELEPPTANGGEWAARGARIRAERIAKGMNCKQLAMRAGVAPNIVSMVELGRLTKTGSPACGKPVIGKLEAALGIGA